MTPFSRTQIFFSLVICAVLTLSSCQKKNLRPTRDFALDERALLIVDEQFNLRPSVIELMKITGLEEAHSLEQAVELTQKHWLRPPNRERAHVQEEFPKLSQQMMPYFSNLGLVNAVQPKGKSYDYVLILGSMYHSFLRRLSFVEQIEGLRFDKIALLGSHRLLERIYETEPMLESNLLTRVPLTEIEMMEALFQESSLFGAIKPSQLIRIASPMKTRADGRVTRANTRDTVEDLLAIKPKPGTALIISSQPYVLRQHLVVKNLLEDPWQLESVGEAADPALNSSVYLDELARTLFELNQIKSKKHE